MQRLACLLALSIGVLAPAAAQAEPEPLVLPRVVNGCAGSTCLETAVVRKGDSVKNGAVIGAVLGGLALGGFATLLCNALHEEGNPPCWKGVLTIGALGAGIGAAAGAGIDALVSAVPRPVIRTPQRSPPSPPLRVTPIRPGA
jgi:hypothetical protein